MPEPTVVTDKKEEKKDKPIGIEVREKTFHQILKEQQQKLNTPEEEKKEEPKPEEKVDEEAQKAKEAEENRKREEEAAKEREEIARKAAEEVVKKQEEEKQKEADRVKAEEEAKKREEALKPAWQKDPNAPKDETGKPIPQSYDQLAEEAARIGEERALARMEAKQAEERAEAAKQEAAKAQTEEQQKAATEAMEKQIQSEIESDLNDLYANNKLPKIKDPKDENDPGNKEYRNLFETAQKVNAERIAKGQAPIRSLKLIYYEHYKPLGKPAGHDAPVLGGESTISNEPPEDKYIVSRDRNKSIAQMVKEEYARMRKGINVRGK